MKSQHNSVFFFTRFLSPTDQKCAESSVTWQNVNIGSNTDLAPNKGQAIIWTNVVMLYWHIYEVVEKYNTSENPLPWPLMTMATGVRSIEVYTVIFCICLES